MLVGAQPLLGYWILHSKHRCELISHGRTLDARQPGRRLLRAPTYPLNFDFLRLSVRKSAIKSTTWHFRADPVHGELGLRSQSHSSPNFKLLIPAVRNSVIRPTAFKFSKRSSMCPIITHVPHASTKHELCTCCQSKVINQNRLAVPVGPSQCYLNGRVSTHPPITNELRKLFTTNPNLALNHTPIFCKTALS